jgi:CRP-like cAMP-binding protein
LVPLRIQVQRFDAREGAAMSPPARRLYKNRILASLPKKEIDRLLPQLSPVTLKLRQELLDGHGDHAYFLEDGLASVVLPMENGSTVEVGVIGIDGVVGLPMLLGADGMPGRTFIQVEGSGYRIDARSLKEEFERPGALRSHLQKYLLANLVQSAQNAACNRLHSIAERLARWLLTCHDRIQSDRMPLTHEFLAQMLGAPRTTVTLAAGILHKAGLIDYSRGHVTIKNRAKLEDVACECYGVVHKEYQRLGLL